MPLSVPADPYPWPLLADVPVERCAVVVVDMQIDFCDPRGYIGQMGYDLAPLRAPIEPTRRVLEAARKAGMKVIHTRQGYRPDMADMPAWRAERFRRAGVPVGEAGPMGRILVRHEEGWQIISELAPDPGEPVIDKTACGAFTGTDMSEVLRRMEVECLAFCGNTIDVCVHTSLREANDRGFQCLLLADCCGAVDPGLHAWSVESIKVEGGVFGSVADSDTFVEALSGASR
ncbi:MAG: cysteine hydrolase [Rhodospirillaceae bacterium]|jgi:biuret amidohydrolase|nr:cysteine hydrolase [Rhodospirillaceae bacterium]